MAFSANGLAMPSCARALSIVGLSLSEAFMVLAGVDGPVESLAQAYREAFSRLRSDPTNEEPLYPGAAACVAGLFDRGVALGIATGNSRRGVRHLLDRLSWHHMFATIQTADAAPSKPPPAMIEQAMAAIGISPADTVMVGDSCYDMAMARSAGALRIGVAWGFQSVEAL